MSFTLSTKYSLFTGLLKINFVLGIPTLISQIYCPLLEAVQQFELSTLISIGFLLLELQNLSIVFEIKFVQL